MEHTRLKIIRVIGSVKFIPIICIISIFLLIPLLNLSESHIYTNNQVTHTGYEIVIANLANNEESAIPILPDFYSSQGTLKTKYIAVCLCEMTEFQKKLKNYNVTPGYYLDENYGEVSEEYGHGLKTKDSILYKVLDSSKNNQKIEVSYVGFRKNIVFTYRVINNEIHPILLRTTYSEQNTLLAVILGFIFSGVIYYLASRSNNRSETIIYENIRVALYLIIGFLPSIVLLMLALLYLLMSPIDGGLKFAAGACGVFGLWKASTNPPSMTDSALEICVLLAIGIAVDAPWAIASLRSELNFKDMNAILLVVSACGPIIVAIHYIYSCATLKFRASRDVA